MKHEFSKAVLAEAAWLAQKHGHKAAAALLGGWPPGPEEELLKAARNGDDHTIRRLLGLELKIGDVAADGTVYAGISPNTNKPMFAAPADTGVYDHYDAEKCAKLFVGHGHKDFRVPTKNELSVLFNNRTAIGGFNATGSYHAGQYWSSSRYYFSIGAWLQRFSDGKQYLNFRDVDASLRLVR